MVTVAMRDLARLGPTIDAAVAAGADRVDGVAFGLRDPQAAEDAARREAVRRLDAKAQLYAQATGKTVRALRTLSESQGYQAVPMMRTSAKAAGAVVPAGELDLRVT